MRGLHAQLTYLYTYPYTNIKKMICPTNAWVWHCSETDWEGKIRDFLKWGIRIPSPNYVKDTDLSE